MLFFKGHGIVPLLWSRRWQNWNWDQDIEVSPGLLVHCRGSVGPEKPDGFVLFPR